MNRRSFRRPISSRQALYVFALLLFAGLQAWRGCTTSAPLPDAVAEGDYKIRRVVDGDTLLLADGKRLRLIGVDTPETVKEDTPVEPWGPEATTFSREFLAAGHARLQFDRERVDRFGRYLAYVWVGDRMLNEELLRAGLARWERHFEYDASMKTRFRHAQDEAREARRGIWSDKSGARHSPAGRLWPIS